MDGSPHKMQNQNYDNKSRMSDARDSLMSQTPNERMDTEPEQPQQQSYTKPGRKVKVKVRNTR